MPSFTNLEAEILLKNSMNPFGGAVKLVIDPLVVTSNIITIKLTKVTSFSFCTAIPKKYPYPQKTQLPIMLKLIIIMKFDIDVSISKNQKRDRTMIMG